MCCDRQNHKTVKAQKKDWPVLIRVDSKVILQNVRQLKDVFQHCLNPVPYFKNWHQSKINEIKLWRNHGLQCEHLIVLFTTIFNSRVQQRILHYTEQFIVLIQKLSWLTLRPHGLQHPKLPCPSLSPGVRSYLCPLSQRCHLTISSSAALFSCPQSFPGSVSIPVNQLFTSACQMLGLQLLHQFLQWIFRVDFL